MFEMRLATELLHRKLKNWCLKLLSSPVIILHVVEPVFSLVTPSKTNLKCSPRGNFFQNESLMYDIIVKIIFIGIPLKVIFSNCVLKMYSRN